MLATLRALGAFGLLLAGCGTAFGRDSAPAPSAPAAPVEKPGAHAPDGPTIQIEAGTLRAGSLPGSPGRDPTREADLVPVALGPFEIDRAPFAGGPAGAEPAKLDYAAAGAACAAAGKRLCSELEWEAACAATGGKGLGARGSEWTLSDGAGPNATTRWGDGADGQRCSARTVTERTAELGFRCCRGDAQPAAYPAPPASKPGELGAKALRLSTEDMRKALAGIADLAALAPSFEPFSSSDVDAALRRGKRTRDGITVWSFLPGAASWTPAANEDLVILSGHSGDQALIAVLYPLGDGSYAHAASAILREPDTSVAIAQHSDGSAPRELLWTSCYGCPNEGGAIRYGDDRRVVIEFR